jgi:hypothetical protein
MRTTRESPSSSNSSIEDRRRSPRVEILDRLHGQLVTLNISVTVREMGLGGMSLETHFAFPIGALHEFHLTMGDGTFAHLTARVKHSRNIAPAGQPQIFITGFEFIEETPKEGDTSVSDLIDKLKSRE